MGILRMRIVLLSLVETKKEDKRSTGKEFDGRETWEEEA